MMNMRNRNFLIAPIAFIALSLGNYLFGALSNESNRISSLSFWFMIFISAMSFARIKMDSRITSRALLGMIFVSYYVGSGFLCINLYAIEMHAYIIAALSFLAGLASMSLPAFIDQDINKYNTAQENAKEPVK